MEQQNGILVLNKPRGYSSARCISFLKKYGQKKIGHAGTLDPNATGVLIVLLGNATKLSNYLIEGGSKTYSGTIRLGITTDTWDSEGKILEEKLLSAEECMPGSALENAVHEQILAWKDLSEQIIPPYSAAKSGGKPLYKLARAGLEVPEKTKIIHISHVEVQSVNLPDVRFRVTCSSGSYMRSLAHSLGIRLGCGAILTELTREYSHPYSLNDAVTPAEIHAEPERLVEWIKPLCSALPEWELVSLSKKQEADVRNGKAVPCLPDENFSEGKRCILQSQEGVPLALAECRMDGLRPVRCILRGLFTQ